MKRLAALAALALAVTPLAGASAEGPRPRAVYCTEQYVVAEPDVRDYLWCLSLREAPTAAAPDALDCFRTYVTRAEPVPQTPEEHVAAVVRDVNRTVTFATCVA